MPTNLSVRRPGGARILGVGAYRPARVVPNSAICELIQSTDEWIQQRSGIVSRRFAGPDETVIAMGVAAGRQALARAGVAADEVDVVLVASMSYLYQSPPAGPQVAHGVGATRAAALDLGAACAGFCHALAVADSLVRAATARHVLVVGAERMSDIIDPTDRSTAFLFGDAAGAVVVGPAEQPGIGPTVWGSDGTKSGLIGHPDSWLAARDKPDYWPTMRMAGREVFRWAITEVAGLAGQAVAEAGIQVADLAAFIPHQANLRIIDRLARELGLPESVVVARDVATAGNTSAASIPLAMDTLLYAGGESPAGAALIAGFGSGLSYSAMVVNLPPAVSAPD
ncbi:ketoacyl-ACP synthase III [Micromonospora sp. 15K316]|uniref:beta-ketoacyl-ACP synthase III n=1 Tax=Micromonospora sp. 15K316 TaxID=2530376 RepID=UPI00104D1648|nr:beta-ketoacyl-ACP synthase III [Micromonospora sp. 15K316]TDC35344.1 ketoacyl-ACP synthase III [Micromonospora sp. 15K316]